MRALLTSCLCLPRQGSSCEVRKGRQASCHDSPSKGRAGLGAASKVAGGQAGADSTPANWMEDRLAGGTCL